MYILTKKLEEGKYNIFDTDDGNNDSCTIAEIREYCRLNIPIKGVTVEGGKLKISPQSKQQGITSTSRRTVRNTLATGNDLSIFNDEQRKIIEEYYVWETVSLYKTLAQSIRLNIRESKVVELVELRGNANWEFGGIRDTGAFGGGMCALGHALRYEYYAVGTDGADTQTLVFGETCASDFLDISKDDMNKLVKVRKSMSDEIAIMIDTVENGTEDEDWLHLTLLLEMLDKIEEQGSSVLVKLFGKKFMYFLDMFREINIPYPESLVKAVGRVIKKDLVAFLNVLFPEYPNAVSFLGKHSIKYLEDEKIWFNMWGSRLTDDLLFSTYLSLALVKKVEGDYGYDPIEETCKDEGGFSKKAKSARHTIIENLAKSLNSKNFTLDELRQCLYMLDTGYTMHNVLNKFLRDNNTNISFLRDNYKGLVVTSNIDLVCEYFIRCADCFEQDSSHTFSWNFHRLLADSKTLFENLSKFAIQTFVEWVTQWHILALEANSKSQTTKDVSNDSKNDNKDLSNYLDNIEYCNKFKALVDKIERNEVLKIHLMKKSIVVNVINTIQSKGYMSEKQYNMIKKGWALYYDYKRSHPDWEENVAESQEEFCERVQKEEEKDNKKWKEEHRVKGDVEQVDGRTPKVVEPFQIESTEGKPRKKNIVLDDSIF